MSLIHVMLLTHNCKCPHYSVCSYIRAMHIQVCDACNKFCGGVRPLVCSLPSLLLASWASLPSRWALFACSLTHSLTCLPPLTHPPTNRQQSHRPAGLVACLRACSLANSLTFALDFHASMLLHANSLSSVDRNIYDVLANNGYHCQALNEVVNGLFKAMTGMGWTLLAVLLMCTRLASFAM